MKMDETKAIEVVENIYWVGFADFEAGFSNNPYLLVDKEEAILFDPGPGHPVFRDLILQKIKEVVSFERIKYIVVHHQDPDLCGLLPFVENLFAPDLVIVSHPRTALFLPYYGIRKNILPVGDGDCLELKSGRRIYFYHTPYLHFAGSMVSYDEKTKSLFSSDIFAVFDRKWKLFADESYIEMAKNFIEHYIGSKDAVMYAFQKLKNLEIKQILPQHGGIIKDNIDKFLEMLIHTEPGKLLKELTNKPGKKEEEIIFKDAKKWLEFWLNKKVDVNSLEDIMQYALREGSTTLSLLLDKISEKARELGVANPLTYGKIHRWNDINTVKSTQLYESIRKKYLSRQYGVIYGDGNLKEALETGLQSFKTFLNLMFVDIRKFTKWSKDKSPEVIIKMLNKEHELISKVIQSHGGRVNKIIGDGILAYFKKEDIDETLKTAIEIHKEIYEKDLLGIGIGISCGEVVMGDIGEDIRLDYTLIGESVNYAARMCDFARKGEIVVTREFFNKVSDKMKQKILDLLSIEEVKVKIKPEDPEIDSIRIKLYK